ncbi:insulinase family protein [Chitinophaga sp. SYP-B3965]|uniref:M16 family metallopeptidase n=1 Tax=Chitinophaga sp. SYP-B3965 TaxID=2663120 RepID=UPI00129986EC|nr:insulinase family protein [Chitinophaga sp. SYP-B3965]MRG47674.1 insulinase family protein [Chitinophaga sp. SYP-B3965]
MIHFCGRIAAAAIAISIFFNGQLFAQDVPLDAAVKVGKLPNGFTYYIRKNAVPEKRAVLYLANNVGSILETDAQQGLAHFLEHMAFNGTKHFPKNELVSYLQKAGVRFGADLNASTSFDETIYQLPVSTEDKTLFRNALQIMRDWAQDITLDGEEIDKERGVILEEKRQRLGSAQRIQDKTMPLWVNQSRYANRLPIGTEEVLKNFSHEEIRKFYEDWYRPDLQALIVVGDVNVAATEKAIISLFSNMKLPPHPKKREEYTIPLSGKNQFLMVNDPEVATMRMEVMVKHPAMEMKTVVDLREALKRTLFGMMMANRFNEIVQKPDAPFLNASSSIGQMMGDLDAFSGRVILKPGGAEKGIKAFWMELERVKQYGFTASELKRAGINYMSTIENAYKERDKTPSEGFVREYVQHFLHGVGSPGVVYEYELYKKIIAELGTDEMNQLAKKYITDTNRDIIIVADDKQKDSLPVMQWLQSVGPVTAYEDKKVTRTTLLDQAPKAGTITSEKVLKEVGATELVLSNGVKVVLKPTEFKKDEIVFNAFSPGGLSLVSDADFYSARMASSLVSASGVSDMTLQELRNLLTGKTVSVGAFIDETTEGISGAASREDLETALQLVYLYFTKPRKDPVAFSNMVEQLRISYSNADQSPGTIFRDTLSAVLGDHHFRKMKMPPEKLDMLDADKALQIYKDRFADASDFTFTFVGSFDVAAIKPLLEKYLGSLPAIQRKETAKDLQLNYPQGRIVRKVIKGKEQQAVVMLAFGGAFEYEKATSDQMRALASILTIRLIERLREQEGGVYNARASVNIRKLPAGEYTFLVNFICDPRNVEPLILSVNSEIMKLKMEGAAEEDLTKYKAGEKSGLDRVMKENSFWLSYLSGKFINGEEPEMPEVRNRMKLITPQSLQQTAVKYFNNANYIRVILVPETN